MTQPLSGLKNVMTKTDSIQDTSKPDLILGTAMWGWNTSRETAFTILDRWYESGFQGVDAATNYPIDKNPDHFRLAENILLDWIKTHGICDLQVMMKVGSLNNMKTSEHLLTRSFLLIMLDEYLWLFGENLDTFMVHWDNRDQEAEVAETMQALEEARNRGLRLGLSGLKFPELYNRLNSQYGFDFRIQCKHNVLQSDYPRYAAFHGNRRFIAYGISGGGIKMSKAEYGKGSTYLMRGSNVEVTERITTSFSSVLAKANSSTERPVIDGFYQLGFINAWYHPDFQAILVAPSNTAQLNDTLKFYETLLSFDYSDVFQDLNLLG